MRWFGQWITFTTVSITLFSIYFGYTALQIYKIVNPQFENTDGPTLDPHWKESQALYADFYLSLRPAWDSTRDFHTPHDVVFVGTFTNLTFDAHVDNARAHELVISKASLDALAQQSQSTEDKAAAAATALWDALRSNETVYLHAHVTKDGASPNPHAPSYNQLATVHQSNPLTKFAARRNANNATFLVDAFLTKPPESVLNATDAVAADPALTAAVVSYWKPHMALRLVTDFTKYPYQEIPVLVFNNLHYYQLPDSSWEYVPSMYLDDMGLTNDKLLPLNRSISSLPLTISIEPMSFARWQLLLTIELALSTQASLGFQSTELDSLRLMVAETHPLLLAITMSVALLHMLFDLLAFKSDIAFWRMKRNDVVGISLRSMVIALISQCVVSLYLLHEHATLLIVGPSVISCLLLVWKILKVVRINGYTQRNNNNSLDTTTATTAAQRTLTQHVDAMATNHMLFVLVPLLVGYALYTLLYKQHTSWYSWVLGTLTGGVYAFGFILMLPQLVINYKLKSVAHLQWRYLIYRALNTFIDDLFAFVIVMPTMHRLSCFRDDIVFVVYLYQRWVYPVDTTRTTDDDDGSSSSRNAVKQEGGENDARHAHVE